MFPFWCVYYVYTCSFFFSLYSFFSSCSFLYHSMLKLFGHKKKKKTLSSTHTPMLVKSVSTTTTSNNNQQPIQTSEKDLKRSISLDDCTMPALMMPKPRHMLPPTRNILNPHEYDKTQIENTTPSPSMLLPNENHEDVVVHEPSNNSKLPGKSVTCILINVY